jgi:hypothetical protein
MNTNREILELIPIDPLFIFIQTSIIVRSEIMVMAPWHFECREDLNVLAKHIPIHNFVHTSVTTVYNVYELSSGQPYMTNISSFLDKSKPTFNSISILTCQT